MQNFSDWKIYCEIKSVFFPEKWLYVCHFIVQQLRKISGNLKKIPIYSTKFEKQTFWKVLSGIQRNVLINVQKKIKKKRKKSSNVIRITNQFDIDTMIILFLEFEIYFKRFSLIIY